MVRAGTSPSSGPGPLLPLWGLLLGLVAGAVWGALARLWMRLITTEEPAFTWSGTLFVIGLFAVTGMLGGLVHGARRRGWRGRPMVALRVLGVLPLGLLAAGPGVVLAPTLLCGGLALARSTWPRWVRGVLVVLALGAVAAVHVDVAQDWPHSGARLLAAVALCLVVYGGAAAALAQGFAATPGAVLSWTARWLLLPVLLVPVLLLVGLASGPQAAVPLVGALAAALLVGVGLLVRRRRTAQPVPSQREAPAAGERTAGAPQPTRGARGTDRTTPV